MTIHPRLLGLLCAVMTLAAVPVVAQETEPKTTPAEQQADETKEKEDETALPSYFAETTVTVTGSERDVFEVATPVSVIREEEIERKAPDNAADILREQPGADVNGVGPNQMRPVIRGQRGLRVLLLENGLRLNNARRQTDFGEIAGIVDLDSVQSMEVVRGPASVLYGSDAIGGVLNLVSRQPAIGGDDFSGYLDLRYGEAGDSARGAAGISGSQGRFAYQLGVTYRDAGEYDAPAGRFGEIDLPQDTTVLDSGVQDQSIWGSLAWSVNDRNVIRFRMNAYQAEDAGFGYVPGEAYGVEEEAVVRILYPEQDFQRFTLSWFGSPENVVADTTTMQLYHQNNERVLVNDIDINIGPIGPGFPDSSVLADSRNFTDLETWGLRAEAVKFLGADARHVLTYGFEGYQDDSFNTDFSTTTTIIRFPGPPFEIVDVQTDAVANAPNAENTSYGVFVQDEFTITPRVRVTAGLRYHNVETKAKPTDGWDISGLDFEDDQVVGALTATFQITAELNALLSYGTAFRAPNIIERLFNGATPEGIGYQILNPDLTSETSDNFDIGLKYRRNNAFMEVVAFRNDIKDGIIQDFLSPEEVAELPQEVQDAIEASGARFVVQQRNVDRLRYEGVELALGYHTPFGLTVGGSYTYLDGERLGGTTILAPDDLYSDKLFAYARYAPDRSRWWSEYNLRYNGDAQANVDPDEPPPPVGQTLPSFLVHNIGAGVELVTGPVRHDISLWLHNVTDELYAEFSNASFFRPEPGRSARLGYRLRF